MRNLVCDLYYISTKLCTNKQFQRFKRNVYTTKGGKILPTDFALMLLQISEVFTDALECIASLISRIMDFEESAAQNRFVVKLGVDEDLDNSKKTYKLP